MIQVNRSLRLPYTSAQIYALVVDIEKYPEFLPYCEAVALHWARGNQLEATVSVSYKALKYSFTTQNTNISTRKITMELQKGPLKSLVGAWKFEDVEEGCEVMLQLNVEFQNKLLDMMLRPKTNEYADVFIDAFVARAKKLYD